MSEHHLDTYIHEWALSVFHVTTKTVYIDFNLQNLPFHLPLFVLLYSRLGNRDHFQALSKTYERIAIRYKYMYIIRVICTVRSSVTHVDVMLVPLCILDYVEMRSAVSKNKQKCIIFKISIDQNVSLMSFYLFTRCFRSAHWVFDSQLLEMLLKQKKFPKLLEWVNL